MLRTQMMDFLALENQSQLLQGADKAEPEKPTKDAGKAEKEWLHQM